MRLTPILDDLPDRESEHASAYVVRPSRRGKRIRFAT